jgi:uncharacterized protein YjbJ (UPF0337 family)
MIRIHDVETGKIVDREMTAAETKAHQADADALQALENAKVSNATAKAALLERLGITADEAKLLLA